MILRYKPSPTIQQFIHEDKFVQGMMGPIGSGKSVACCVKLIMLAIAQKPDKNNVRRSRWAIIRNTYRELLDTTMQTFFTWIDKETGSYSALNMTFIIDQPLEDGTKLYVEFMFRALDRPDDIKKLLSLELTGAWVNEARELPKAVIDMLQGRVGRYPSRFIHVEPSWFGVIMDTNPPDSDHWWYNIFEEVQPDNHVLYKQPSGLADNAENIDNLPPNYYVNMQAGKTAEWINVYVHGKYGYVADGKPVFPEYNDSIHYDPTPPALINKPSTTIYVGIDYGLTPAAVIAHQLPTGQLRIIDELVSFNMGAVNFGRLLHQKLCKPPYDNTTIELYGDPAGEQRAQTDETTPMMIMQQQGLSVYPAYTNDFRIRREVVADLLTTLTCEGKPSLTVTSTAPQLRKALAGGYQYKRMQVSGAERYQDKPNKNQFSHVADALQYLCLGAVGDDRIIGGSNTSRQPLDYSTINRSVV